MGESTKQYNLGQIDDNWTAVHQATLLFIVDGDKILLIRKKRGLGAGKINGPGGKLDAGETILECAVREVQEELGVTPLEPEKFAELRFQFTDDYSIHVHVFISCGYTGVAKETEEAIPLWYSLTDIPYEQMWADDEIWLPRILGGEQVCGRFIFDGDKMLDYQIDHTA